jgi:hypothetical protein
MTKSLFFTAVLKSSTLSVRDSSEEKAMEIGVFRKQAIRKHLKKN